MILSALFCLIAKTNRDEAESVTSSSEEESTLLCGHSESTAIEKQNKRYLMKSISNTFCNRVRHVTVMHQKLFFTAKFV